MKKVVLLMMLVLIMISCTQIDYVGREYPPTSQVDLYFAEGDVGRDYTVMGHIIASADDFVSAGKMQKKIMEKAKEKGADGVIILGLERYQSGEWSTHKEETKTEKKKSESKSTTTSTTRTDVQEKKEIKAMFIKYK